jgi:hypothetical protein
LQHMLEMDVSTYHAPQRFTPLRHLILTLWL